MPNVVKVRRFVITLAVPLSRSVSSPPGEGSLLETPECTEESLLPLSLHHPPIQSPRTDAGRPLLF